jgi:hypothetical protein
MIACRVQIISVLVIALALGQNVQRSWALQLITKEEASLPPSDRIDVRGPFPGPTIEVLSPPSDVAQTSPVRLVVRFETYAGSEIDTEAIRVIYMKTPPVELTGRVYDFITLKGIEIREAEVPPGTHTIRIQVRDRAGRTGSSVFTFRVER